MPDKKRERKILRRVFDESGFAIVDEDESPDFVLATRFGIRVGVEVTELYRSQSDARVTRIPGYFDELISGPRFRHRDDVETIRVVDIEIQSPAGDGTYVPEQKVKGILWDHLQPPQIHEIPVLERMGYA